MLLLVADIHVHVAAAGCRQVLLAGLIELSVVLLAVFPIRTVALSVSIGSRSSRYFVARIGTGDCGFL